ncbi:MAG: MotA/TolQ/ExbB proton channel family protein [Bernardetiaceae bacterium]|nr:MotA/TolQ/ExbB proton channel family protein [Bernardetiaceae bacterium]
MFLLQAIDSTNLVEVASEANWFEIILIKGGWSVWLLLAMGLFGLILLFERFLLYRKVQVGKDKHQELFSKICLASTKDEALTSCRLKEKDTISAPLFMEGIRISGTRNITSNYINSRLEEVGITILAKYERWLDTIALIASIAPMIGFFGTVLGMIQAFNKVAQMAQPPTPRDLAGGIYEALISTLVGLGIGLFLQFCHGLLTQKLNKIATILEESRQNFMKMPNNHPDVVRRK